MKQLIVLTSLITLAAGAAQAADRTVKLAVDKMYCDACPITGGESTENEMFVLFGAMFIDPTVPDADFSCEPYPQ